MLLNSWCLFEQRALFDNACFASKTNHHIAQQVYVACNFCGKPLARNPKGLPEISVPAVNNASNNDKKVQATLNNQAIQKHQERFQTCPTCKKAAPRCAVCLINTGSHSGYLTGQDNLMKSEKKLTPLEAFMLFCNACRHGGHMGHLEGKLIFLRNEYIFMGNGVAKTWPQNA